tara:strand:+ start:896 stop:1762 length:867 start_codon:yes stop_codon:yes gene_type:complete
MIIRDSFMNTPIRIFVDNCILSHSEMLESAILTKYDDEGKMKAESLGYIPKDLPHDTKSWLSEQIESLPTIAKKAGLNDIQLYSYPELRYESWHRSAIRKIGFIFADIEIQEVESAVERSYFQQSDLSLHLQKDRIIGFYKSLLNFEPSKADFNSPMFKRLPPHMVTNLKNIERFKAICKGISDNQLLDAFHLWSAETNNMDYFLTVDKKFIRVMTQSKSIDLPCPPISPSQLIEQLDEDKKTPFKYQKGEFIDFLGHKHELEKQTPISFLHKLKSIFKSLLNTKTQN